MPPSEPTKREMMSKQVEPRYLEITALIDRVCRQYLNEEYAEMGRKLAARLAQKSPSPLLRGRPEVWACAIVYAIGTVNFLFSPSFEPYLSAEELCQAFGVKKNTGSNKAVQIRKMFGMRYMTPEWTLPSHIIRNHLVWLVIMDGMLVDIRDMPREVQELAYKQGLIPYIPADREKS